MYFLHSLQKVNKNKNLIFWTVRRLKEFGKLNIFQSFDGFYTFNISKFLSIQLSHRFDNNNTHKQLTIFIKFITTYNKKYKKILLTQITIMIKKKTKKNFNKKM